MKYRVGEEVIARYQRGGPTRPASMARPEIVLCVIDAVRERIAGGSAPNYLLMMTISHAEACSI